MWLFSPFHLYHIFKHRSTSWPNRSLLFTNLLVLVPTAVIARSFNFNPLKTKIRHFSLKYISILYHIPEAITTRHFPKIVPLHSLRVERLKLWTSFVSFYSASPRNTATQRANYTPFLSNHVINKFFSFFLFFFLLFPLVQLFCGWTWNKFPQKLSLRKPLRMNI